MASKITEVRDYMDKSLNDNSKPWSAFFAKAEEATGVNRTYLFCGAAVFLAFWLVFGFAAQLICNIVGFAYPAYVSIHAIETSRVDDDKKWLTYWVVFSIFSIIEFFTDVITRFVPLYWLIKCIFMVWLMIPTDLNGSLLIYNRVIRPYFLKHHNVIDDALSKAKEQATKLMKDQ